MSAAPRAIQSQTMSDPPQLGRGVHDELTDTESSDVRNPLETRGRQRYRLGEPLFYASRQVIWPHSSSRILAPAERAVAGRDLDT